MSAGSATPGERRLLRHFLAAIAYRTQKAIRDAARIETHRPDSDQALPAALDEEWPERGPTTRYRP